jgi:hypothetical protein
MTNLNDDSQWRNVTPSSPCGVCEKSDWCRVSHDGAIAICRRCEDHPRYGKGVQATDTSGSDYFTFRLTDPSAETDAWPLPKFKMADGGGIRANADDLHGVYSRFVELATMSDQHADLLRQRGVNPELMREQGYATLGQNRAEIVQQLIKDGLEHLLPRVPGFRISEKGDRRFWSFGGYAGLLVPIRDSKGRIVGLMVRPDLPNERGKYMWCTSKRQGGPSPGAPMHVPQFEGDRKTVRLTEGALKAEIATRLSAMLTIGTAGINGQASAIETLRDVGSEVVRVAFDADARTNPHVAKAVKRLVKLLRAACFAVELEVWSASDGKGIDDLLANGKQPEVLRDKAAVDAAVADTVASAANDPHLRLVKGPETDDDGLCDDEVEITGEYFVRGGCTFRRRTVNDGHVDLPLCNFAAQIVEEVEYDDGAETTRTLSLQGALSSGAVLPRVEVKADDFSGMTWPVIGWGTRAVIYAGNGTRDHLRCALQMLSKGTVRRTVYRHLGWRLIDDEWLYLHGSGAITSRGFRDISVSLPDALANYSLPIPTDTALKPAIQASLRFLEFGPARIVVPILAAAYRSILGDTDFGIHLTGPTGNYKSEVAALGQQHFGAAMNARHLPANWSSTGNALEGLAFAAKDALMVVDDFAPHGSTADVQRYHRDADRLFRGQGNRAGRQRMRADATLRPTKPPRGLLLSTGEDTPRGQSLRARLLVLEISPGDLGPPPPAANPKLSVCQMDAANGLYASALAGFIQWIAPQLDQLKTRYRSEHAEHRDQARLDGQHARTPGIVADLAWGFRYFLEFAVAKGAINEMERKASWQHGWSALLEAGREQVDLVGVSEPASQFVRLLWAAIASGSAHVSDKDGAAPSEPERWGWRAEESYARGDHHTQYCEQGTRVGWLVDDQLYIEPDASYAAVQRLAQQQGEGFVISAITLRRRLRERGLLASTDDARNKVTVRRVLQGERRDVLHLRIPERVVIDSPHSFQTGPKGPSDDIPQENGPDSWAGTWADSDDSAHAPAHGMAHSGRGTDEMGRLGRSETGGESNLANSKTSGEELWL